jgi:hypothetical protein
VGQHRGAGAEPEAVAALAAVVVASAVGRGAVAPAALCDRDRRGGSSSLVRSSSGAGGSRGEARAASGLRRRGGALRGREEGVARGRGEGGEAVAPSCRSPAATGEEGHRRGGEAEAPGEGVGLRLIGEELGEEKKELVEV